MSEKIYACLLRLFPRAFRGQYQQEALRLLRDRLRDERGIFRRMRLNFDLLADIIRALPLAYRNTYTQAAPASLTPGFRELPSFQVLPKEPMRRGALVMAGLLSFSALGAFMYVMERPDPYHPALPNGHKSPIEVVMEHLNQPASLDTAGNVPPHAPEPAAPRAVGQPAGPGGQVPNAGDSGRPSSRGVATPSSPTAAQQTLQGQPAPLQDIARSAGPFNMQVPAAVAANSSGTWTGPWRAMGGDADLPRSFSLRQNSATLTGTGGPNSTEQYPVIHGLVTGDSVSFELKDGRKTFLYDLRAEDQGLRGTVSIRTANGTRTAAVWLERTP